MLKPQKEENEREKSVYNTASELYNDFLETYFHEYIDLSNANRSKLDIKYPGNLTLDECYYSE